jgi:hypothetical protein
MFFTFRLFFIKLELYRNDVKLKVDRFRPLWYKIRRDAEIRFRYCKFFNA